MTWLQFSGLLLCAYIVLGNGSCGTSPDQDTILSKDVCGPAAPYYWKGGKSGKDYEVMRCKAVGAQCTVVSMGKYSEPILLECPADSTDYYLVKQ